MVDSKREPSILSETSTTSLLSSRDTVINTYMEVSEFLKLASSGGKEVEPIILKVVNYH